MKKLFYIFIVLTVMTLGTCVIAEVVTTRQVTQPQPQQQTNVPTTSRLASNVKTCKPYSETLRSQSTGIDFNFNIAIRGWSNNKCMIDFVGKTEGMGALAGMLGFAGIEMVSFEPNVHCEFTKQQLQSVGDAILQEEERNRGARNNMLKDPSQINVEGFLNPTGSDAALMDVVFNQGACTISNMSSNPITDFNIDSLFGF